MKRFLIVIMVTGLVAGSLATAKAKEGKQPKRVERTVKGSYGPYPAPVTGCNEPLGRFACLMVGTYATESFFTAKVTDTHGRPVSVEVTSSGFRATFCGETSRPIAFPPGATLEFHLGARWLGLHCMANRVKTVGTIRVTLSNR